MTGARAVALLALLALAASACGQQTVADGEACTRSAQCEWGFACVEGACSDDLTPLEDPERIPILSPPAAPDAAMAADAGAG